MLGRRQVAHPVLKLAWRFFPNYHVGNMLAMPPCRVKWMICKLIVVEAQRQKTFASVNVTALMQCGKGAKLLVLIFPNLFVVSPSKPSLDDSGRLTRRIDADLLEPMHRSMDRVNIRVFIIGVVEQDKDCRGFGVLPQIGNELGAAFNYFLANPFCHVIRVSALKCKVAMLQIIGEVFVVFIWFNLFNLEYDTLAFEVQFIVWLFAILKFWQASVIYALLFAKLFKEIF